MVVKKRIPSANVVATIDLVAQTAGVSRATVSRVMNGTAKVSPDTEVPFVRQLKNIISHQI